MKPVFFITLFFVVYGTASFEELFRSIPEPGKAKEYLRYLTSEAHVAGTPSDNERADFVMKKFQSFGLETYKQFFNALVSYPEEQSELVLHLINGTRIKAKLAEDIVSTDPASQGVLRNHSFHGYAPSGELNASYVYVNYGTVEDFDFLSRNLSIDLQGKIAFSRYGKIFRGLKVRHAQLHGMIGCVIFSDPADDGFSRGLTYPLGPWRPPSGIQRGSVQFNSLCAGDPGMIDRDPSICGYSKEELIPQIPSIPISYEDAYPLLQALAFNPSPDLWKGGFDLPYNIGPSSDTLYLKVNNTFQVKTLVNIIGEFHGEDTKDVVILGNHRDAWVVGAADPNSGTAVILEVARAMGEIRKKGWKPKRSIRFASWDGEEFGLLGSTDYGERNALNLKQNAIAYLNMDTAVSGSNVKIGSTPSLIPLFEDITKLINNPETNSSLYDAWDKHVDVLGSGSDYTVFLDHLGIASIDLSFHGDYGVYHSVYDSFEWMQRFGDPEFRYHQTAAQLWGSIALRLADAPLLPFDFSVYVTHIRAYAEEVESFSARNDLSVDFSGLFKAIQIFEHSAIRFGNVAHGVFDEPLLLKWFNDRSKFLERQFLAPNGLSNRKWFKHFLQAPGIDLGYGADTFPAITESIRAKNEQTASVQVQVATKIITDAAAFLAVDTE